MKFSHIIVLLFFLPNFLSAHDPGGVGLTLGAKSILNSNYTGYGTELHLTAIGISAGISQDFILKSHPRTSLYFGLGFSNPLQIQYGYNFHSDLIRIRTEIPIFTRDFSWTYSRNQEFYKRLNFLMSYEFDLDKKKNNQFGIGITLLIDDYIF